MIVMLTIFAIFVIGKSFMWAKCAMWRSHHYGDENGYYPEHQLGEVQVLDEPKTFEGRAKEFGFNQSAAHHENTPRGDSKRNSGASGRNVGNGEPAMQEQPESPPASFGFASGKRAESSAERVRREREKAALHERVGNRADSPLHVRVGDSSHLHERVLHARVGESKSSEKSSVYARGEQAKVGSEIDCPQCGSTFRKSNKWHTFCCSSCKDDWHNAQDPARVEALKAVSRKRGKSA